MQYCMIECVTWGGTMHPTVSMCVLVLVACPPIAREWAWREVWDADGEGEGVERETEDEEAEAGCAERVEAKRGGRECRNVVRRAQMSGEDTRASLSFFFCVDREDC